MRISIFAVTPNYLRIYLSAMSHINHHERAIPKLQPPFKMTPGKPRGKSRPSGYFRIFMHVPLSVYLEGFVAPDLLSPPATPTKFPYFNVFIVAENCSDEGETVRIIADWVFSEPWKCSRNTIVRGADR